MKVCMLTSVHTVWDTRIYHREARSLAQSGYNVTIVATGIDSQKSSTEGIEIIGLKRPRWRIERGLNWVSFLRVALRIKADIYHFHDPDLLLVGYILSILTAKPVIYDNHDPYVEAILQREWLPLWLRPIFSQAFDFVERFLTGRFVVIIANDIQQTRFPNAILLHNYPALSSFAFAAPHRNPDSFQIMHAGVLTEPRGVFELVEIGSLLAHRNVMFSFLGNFANESLEAEIKKQIEQRGLQHIIGLEGRVPHQRIVSALAEASVGLIPYNSVPNHLIIIPTKLFEYMAAAVPVVASDLPPIRRYIAETQCGLLVPPGDPKAFAAAIEHLLDHPEEACRMGNNGRQAVLARFNWEQEEERLLSLYRELI